MYGGGVSMKEDKFNELLKINDDFNKDINKKINKAMRKQINSRVIAIIVTIAIIIAGIYCGVSFALGKPNILDNISYNPFNENDFVVIEEEGNRLDGYHVLMGTFIGMNYPGKFYYGSSFEDNYIKNGLGSYDIKAKIQDIMDPLHVDGISNITFQIRNSSMDYETSVNHMLSRTMHEFYDERYKEQFDDFWLYYSLNDIKELPDSAILDVSLSFDKTKSLEDTVEFINEYKGSIFHWIATDVNNYSIANGISLYDAAIYGFTDKANKEYPGFYLNNDLTADSIKESYLSKLKLLIDHEDFIRLLDSCFKNPKSLQVSLKERYEAAKSKGVEAIGIRGIVKKADLLQMIEKNQLKFAFVNNAKLSKLQK